MPIRYFIDRNKQYILEEWDGAISITDLEAYWTSYLSDPEVLKIRRTLVDLRDVVINFKGLELDDLIQKVVVPKLGGLNWKTALVVARPAQYGVSRQYQVFANRYSKDSIFFDPVLAEQWLLSE